LEVAPNLRHLYAHLVDNHWVEDVRDFKAENLSIYSSSVLKKLQAGEAGWETQVPAPIAEVIKSKKLFGCK
jgi:hypothetical protein